MHKIIIVISAFVFILIPQATWIFLDARKREERMYWLWGLFGLIQFPTAFIAYLLVTRTMNARTDKFNCPSCNKKIGRECHCCPYCGQKLKNVCPGCSKVIEGDWEYCPGCSRKLRE